MLNLQSNGATIIRGNLYDRQCNTPECVDKAKFLLGLSQGLSYLTPAGAVAGAGQIAYNLTTAIINNGGEATAIAVIQGIKGLPENIMAGLMSDDPRVRGETLVTALTIPVVAAAVGRKVGVTVLENIGTGPAAGSRTAQRGGVPVGDGAKGSGATGGTPVVLDLFGGRTSQIPGAINVDIVAEQGVRASATQLPFGPATADRIIASNPYLPGGSGIMDWLPDEANSLKSGGTLTINATQLNKFGQLPSADVLDSLGLKVVQPPGPLLPEFQGNIFRYTDGGQIPSNKVLSTVLQKTGN